MAVIKLKISPAEFWDMSWQEWMLYVQRYLYEEEDKKNEYQDRWNRYGAMAAAIYNIHRDEKIKPDPFTIKDFVNFESPNIDEKVEKKISLKDLKGKMGTKFNFDGINKQ